MKYRLQPFYKPSQADDRRVDKATDPDTTNPGLRRILKAICSNDAEEASAESSGNANTAPISHEEISKWIQETELRTPLLPYLRTACLNAATAKTRLSLPMVYP
jgi:hypothetical protein